MSVLCPCCGSEMHTPGLAALRHMRLPPHERKVLDALINVYPRFISVAQVVDRVYGDDPSGGPDTAVNAVSVYMSRLRPKLATYGWTAGRSRDHSAGIGLWQLDHGAAATGKMLEAAEQ